MQLGRPRHRQDRSGVSSLRATVVPLAIAQLVIPACYDPVHLDAVANLGPETNGVEPGPSHRAGQPCSTCHGDEGPARRAFSIAGTLYNLRGMPEPLNAGSVNVTDATGESRTTRSNEVGNFFIARSDWDPTFPLEVAIEADGIRRGMVTRIGRDGSCAVCHRDQGDHAFMPGVFLFDR